MDLRGSQILFTKLLLVSMWHAFFIFRLCQALMQLSPSQEDKRSLDYPWLEHTGSKRYRCDYEHLSYDEMHRAT